MGLVGVSVTQQDIIETIGRSGKLVRWSPIGKKLATRELESLPTEMEIHRDRVLVGDWNGVVSTLDEKNSISKLEIPNSRTTNKLVSLQVEPRRSTSFRDAVLAIPRKPSENPFNEQPLLYELSNSKSPMPLADSAATFFRQKQVDLEEEAREFQRVISEFDDLTSKISKLEKEAGLSDDLAVLASLVETLERHREQLASEKTRDIEVLLRVTQEHAHSMIGDAKRDVVLSESTLEVAKNCESELDELAGFVAERISDSPKENGDPWIAILKKIEAEKTRLLYLIPSS